MEMMNIEKRKLLNPKIDYTFKRIFGFIGNEEITKGLISAIIDDIKIKEITLDCKEIQERDLQDDKLGILDIKAVLDNSIQCNIEMQMVDQSNIEERILYYWSKMYSQSVKMSKDYITSQRTIVILFTDYELKNLKGIEKYISKWHIREKEYQSYILTKKLEIAIIEIPKYKRYAGKNKELDIWVKFIDKPEELRMEEIRDNKALEEAKKVLEEISMDEHERELQWKRELVLMDKKAIEKAGYEKGIAEGIVEGIEKGIEQGQEEEKVKIAKNALKLGMKIETVEQLTGLSKEEIEKLRM